VLIGLNPVESKGSQSAERETESEWWEGRRVRQHPGGPPTEGRPTRLHSARLGSTRLDSARQRVETVSPRILPPAHASFRTTRSARQNSTKVSYFVSTPKINTQNKNSVHQIALLSLSKKELFIFPPKKKYETQSLVTIRNMSPQTMEETGFLTFIC